MGKSLHMDKSIEYKVRIAKSVVKMVEGGSWK